MLWFDEKIYLSDVLYIFYVCYCNIYFISMCVIDISVRQYVIDGCSVVVLCKYICIDDCEDKYLYLRNTYLQ